MSLTLCHPWAVGTRRFQGQPCNRTVTLSCLFLNITLTTRVPSHLVFTQHSLYPYGALLLIIVHRLPVFESARLLRCVTGNTVLTRLCHGSARWKNTRELPWCETRDAPHWAA